jgi:hypothetical protein
LDRETDFFVFVIILLKYYFLFSVSIDKFPAFPYTIPMHIPELTEGAVLRILINNDV